MSAPKQDEKATANEKAPERSQDSSDTTDSSAPENDYADKKKESADQPKDDGAKDEKDEKQPPGGYDDTPIPRAPPGYTVKFTFHRATNLPMADVNSLSSDPYILAQLNTGLATRHKEDPYLRMRSFTVRRETNPEWNWEWVVANVPASGFKLKARIYDEDPADHDDRLGNVHVNVDHIDENWKGIKDQNYKVKMRMGSKRAYFIRAIAVSLQTTKHLRAQLWVSVEVLGRTPGEDGGRCFTIGPNWWTKHYSPLLGRIANRKEASDDDDKPQNGKENSKPKAQRYNFQANQIQLTGPVPAQLYHRYVEFRPIIKSGFNNKGVRGFIFNKALHHQHKRVYNFSRTTEYGVFEDPPKDITRKFLELVNYDKGGRIYTYVLTLDALWRFTETGKEFGIDMLSKHTMHSDVSIYIAFSGEFFVRRLKYRNRDPPEEGGDNPTHPPNDISGGPPKSEPPNDPSRYELVIDNDSGTYRPNPATLPYLKEFLEKNLPGLKIVTLDCQKDADKMAAMKQEQRDRKAKEGNQLIYTQLSHSDSESSSDEDALDDMEEAGEYTSKGFMKLVTGDVKKKKTAKKQSMKQHYAYRPKGKDSEPIETRNGEAAKTLTEPVAGEQLEPAKDKEAERVTGGKTEQVAAENA